MKTSEQYLEDYITCHLQSELLKLRVTQIAPYPNNVLVLGESGTGKELIARALHGSRHGDFIATNCTAMPAELIESLLFGHVRGAFTGAIETTIGKLRAAANGTIFLDEIGDMPLDMQAKLLRFLDYKVITPVGANKEVEVNTRVIAATNKNLPALVAAGKFREDLLYRLAELQLTTFPLREREDDWPLLATHFGAPNFPYEKLRGHPLKGNVREFRNYVTQFKIFHDFEFMPSYTP